jgi:hypothetical protein
MTGVEQNAGTERFVVGKEARNLCVDPSNVDANAKLHFEQRYDVRNGADAEAEALPEFRSVLLGLSLYITPQDGPFRRIVPNVFDTQKVLQLDFSLRKIRHQFSGCITGSVTRAEDFPKSRGQVDLYSFVTQKGVYRSAVKLCQLL